MTTIAHVSAASANGTSLAMPSHQAGDMLIFTAYRDASNTSPTIPAGWLTIVAGGGSNTNSIVICYKIAASGSETSGTWTNATQVACSVYRATTRIGVGGFRYIATATSLTITWTAFSTSPGAAIARQNGNTWHVGIVGYRTNDANCQAAPTLMTNRTNTKGASTGQISIHDSDGDIAAWANTSQTYSVGTPASSMNVVLELIDTGYSVGSGGMIVPGDFNGGYQ